MSNNYSFKLVYSMVILVCLFTMNLYSQPIDYEGSTAGGITICAAAPAYDEKGGFLLAGYTTGDEKGGPIYWIRITRYGNVLWQGGNESHPDLENLFTIRGICGTSDGGFVMVGHDFNHIKIDKNGTYIAGKSDVGDNPFGSCWYINKCRASGNCPSGYIIIGDYTGPASTNASTIYRTDKNFNIVKAFYYDNDPPNYAHVYSSVKQTEDGGFLLTGTLAWRENNYRCNRLMGEELIVTKLDGNLELEPGFNNGDGFIRFDGFIIGSGVEEEINDYNNPDDNNYMIVGIDDLFQVIVIKVDLNGNKVWNDWSKILKNNDNNPIISTWISRLYGRVTFGIKQMHEDTDKGNFLIAGHEDTDIQDEHDLIVMKVYANGEAYYWKKWATPPTGCDGYD